MNIDTQIRHITKPGTNLFTELGFSTEEAKAMQAASRQQVNEQLMRELINWINAQRHIF